MRILQISHRNYIAGGSDAVFFATCDLLESLGHEVVRFCMQDERNEPYELSRYFPRGADTARPSSKDAVRYFYNRDAARRLSTLLAEQGPFDLAHLHIYHSKMTPAILPVLKRAGIPIVHTLHEYKLVCPVYTMERNGSVCRECTEGSVVSAVRNRCKNGSALHSGVMAAEYMTARAMGDVRLVDRFICVSDFQRREMEQGGLPPEKLSTLHNFVDTEFFKPGNETGEALLYFGRIEKLKGLPTLIQAVAKTGQTLKIVGDGSWVAPMQEMIKGMPKVTYLGFRSGDALRELIRRSSAVVVPSEWFENCPMSVLEAKACGVPVVGARIGGIPELIEEGADGFLFPPGNTDALADVLHSLEQVDIGKTKLAARKNALERYSRRAHAKNLLIQYQQAEGLALTRCPPRRLRDGWKRVDRIPGSCR